MLFLAQKSIFFGGGGVCVWRNTFMNMPIESDALTIYTVRRDVWCAGPVDLPTHKSRWSAAEKFALTYFFFTVAEVSHQKNPANLVHILLYGRGFFF